MDKVIIKAEDVENIPNYILYTQALGDIDVTLYSIKDEINNLTTQTFELNKTMNNIAESLRVISHNNR